MKRRGRLKRNTERAKQWLRKSKLSDAIQKLNRRKPLKARGRRWAEKRARDFGEKADWVRTLPCLCCGYTPSDPHHEPPRSLGGTSKDLVPLCRFHHQGRHDLGLVTFSKMYGCVSVDRLLDEARWIEREWQSMEAA